MKNKKERTWPIHLFWGVCLFGCLAAVNGWVDTYWVADRVIAGMYWALLQCEVWVTR